MVILGIDPGLNTVGYGVLEASRQEIRLLEAGVIQGSSSQDSLERRLFAIYKEINKVIEERRPQALALEELYSHYEYPTTAILMGHARGVICLAAAQHNIPLFSYPSTRIKLLLTGSGQAGKVQMQRAVQARLGLKNPPEPDDIADALAVGICHSMAHGSPDLIKTIRK